MYQSLKPTNTLTTIRSPDASALTPSSPTISTIETTTIAKSSSTMIIIIVAIVVVFIIGIAGYFYWRNTQNITPTIVPSVVTDGYQGCWLESELTNYSATTNADQDLYTGNTTLAQLKVLVKAKYPLAKYMALTAAGISTTNSSLIERYVIVGTSLPTGTKLFDNNPKCNITQLGYKMGCKVNFGQDVCANTDITTPTTWTVYSI